MNTNDNIETANNAALLKEASTHAKKNTNTEETDENADNAKENGDDSSENSNGTSSSSSLKIIRLLQATLSRLPVIMR